MLAFDQAVQTAVGMVDLRETLVIATADHSHSFQLFGEPSRFESILEIDRQFSDKVCLFQVEVTCHCNVFIHLFFSIDT